MICRLPFHIVSALLQPLKVSAARIGQARLYGHPELGTLTLGALAVLWLRSGPELLRRPTVVCDRYHVGVTICGKNDGRHAHPMMINKSQFIAFRIRGYIDTVIRLIHIAKGKLIIG